MTQFPKIKTKRLIYMDHAAATPVDSVVLQTMMPYLNEKFANPGALHSQGREVKIDVDSARKQISDIFNTQPRNIIFTASGTESDNLAILGVSRASSKYQVTSNKKFSNHVVTTKIEHHAVLRACKKLEKEGFEITYLKTDKHGLITPKQIIDALKNKTLLISVMYANNEIGTIEPIADIGKAILKWKKENKRKPDQPPFFHTDACQAAGYLDLNVNKLHVDLLTINGSKIYGPKGVGVLYKSDHVKLEPMLFGGGQEFRFRAGTENVQGIVGTAKALEIADKTKEKEIKRLTKLRDYFIKEATKQIPNTTPNGHPELRLPNNVNLTFLGVEGEALLLYLDEYGISASTGSACTSESLDPSHVILALGRPYEYAHGSIRFSLGRCTKKGDIDYVLEILPRLVEKLREISALSRKPQAVKP